MTNRNRRAVKQGKDKTSVTKCRHRRCFETDLDVVSIGGETKLRTRRFTLRVEPMIKPRNMTPMNAYGNKRALPRPLLIEFNPCHAHISESSAPFEDPLLRC